MNPHDRRILHSSLEAHWRTPPQLFIGLDRQFHFDTDVCASADATFCDRWFGPDHHDPTWRDATAIRPALGQRWGDVCFINPPWSRTLDRAERQAATAETPYRGIYNIAQWAARCAAHAAAGATVVGVFPYSHQTEWWAQWVRHGPAKAHEIREIPHRVSFLRPDGTAADNAGGNTAIVIWQPNPGYVGDWQPLQRVWDYR